MKRGLHKHSINELSGNHGFWTSGCSPSFRLNRIINNNNYRLYNTGGNPNLGNNTISDKGNNSILDNDGGNI